VIFEDLGQRRDVLERPYRYQEYCSLQGGQMVSKACLLLLRLAIACYLMIINVSVENLLFPDIE
jgi:hypothetical protein